ncbi:hypothetical protein ACROYT_G000628 [Oculina patagonica]
MDGLNNDDESMRKTTSCKKTSESLFWSTSLIGHKNIFVANQEEGVQTLLELVWLFPLFPGISTRRVFPNAKKPYPYFIIYESGTQSKIRLNHRGTKMVHYFRTKIFRLAVVLSVLLASQAYAGKSSRRFIGLPESGERVKYSNTSENSKTLIIRHNLPGRIIFHESSEFWIELLTTTQEKQNNSQVKISYTSLDNNETILLQVNEPSLPEPADTSESDKLLVIILSSVGSFLVLGLVVSALCYFCYWKKRRKPALKKEAAKTSSEENSTTESHRVSGASLGRGRPGPSGTQLLVVAVCACALHAQLQKTNVEINVYFPGGFFRSNSKVFLRSENNNEVRVISNDTQLKINVFDVPNAGPVSEDRCIDRNMTCANGACDPLAGKCVCPRKMRGIRQKGGDTRCVFRCNQKCPSGFFELSSCNHTHQAVCKKCRPQCNFKEFESVSCAGKTDRNCTDISKLPQIKVSPNIVYEDILKVKADLPVKQTIDNLSSNSEIWLNRSSGMAIQLQILLVDFSTTFREVKHDVNDNSRLPNNAASQNIVRNFCRSPVPDYYRINLQESANEVQIIKGKPNTPCPKYDGGSNSIPAPGNVLSCNGAENPTVRLFGVKSMAEDFYKEERSRACYNLKQDCDKCRNDCTVRARANPICNLTKSDVDADSKQEYGEHFTYCFDCCFEEDCICPSCACTQYNSSCINSSVTCVGAKHFTIPITPVFPNTGLFKCHVELSKGPVFELETSLWKNGKLLKRIEKNQRNYSKEFESGTTSYDYGYMILKHPSVLRSNMRKTIMISGKAGESNFDVGWYMTEKELESPNPATTLSIQPTHPFKINTKDWPRENCLTLDTEKFVIISPGVSIDNVKNLAQLTAKVANEQNARVYKVYNTSGSHQVHFEVPPERSVLRYAFPETVIFNDRSFTGKLLKNRTFWTIRLTGQASSCPGFFMVRLTDQDRPDVDVYHYDIAITNQECSFRVEFHLPSGGDTNMIDKQFVVRLTDSRKTMKLILVSPRRIPEFEIPDIDDDFDLKKLEVLIPFGGAAGGMFIVLIAILIYGYKTRPKDSYHRDRDNELHFRHVLFVVWFVGMRLVKSFLLTLTVLFVILTAIHYTNVKTLEKYETFHKQRKQLEEDFIQQMDTHKVQEINRQWSLLGEGKVVCDQKLKELNVFLERHFKEMRARQLEEMRRKSIILAAEHRIKKQFNETRAKFERERKRLNDQMEAYSNEINSRISRIERKIEGSFWLKAAKVLYKILDALASIFGSGIGKPFIAWVGLSVDFPSIDANLPSFDDIFSDFSSFSLVPHNGEENSNSSIWRGNSLTDIKIHIQQISVPDLNISRPLTKEKAEELLALEWIVQLYRSGVFTTILVILDVLWFVYRHSKTYQLAVVLIHGFPRVYELEKIQKKEEEKEEKKKKKRREVKEKGREKSKEEKRQIRG